MDLEHLNKTQIILLTLLVSFVTSIATGIVTVSLVNQAPPEVAATVNHIIERTVQQVVPSTQTAAAVQTVKTVVVKDDDLASQSITNVQKSMIRIVASSSPDLLVSRGLVIDGKGVAITDRAALDGDTAYLAILPDGTFVPVTVRPTATTTAIAVMDLKIGTSTALSAATFADPKKLALGQTVIRIGGNGRDSIAEGIVSALPGDEKNPEVETSISSTIPGSVLLSLFGEVIGITTADSLKKGQDFYSVSSIFKAAAASADAASTAASASASAAR